MSAADRLISRRWPLRPDVIEPPASDQSLCALRRPPIAKQTAVTRESPPIAPLRFRRRNREQTRPTMRRSTEGQSEDGRAREPASNAAEAATAQKTCPRSADCVSALSPAVRASVNAQLSPVDRRSAPGDDAPEHTVCRAIIVRCSTPTSGGPACATIASPEPVPPHRQKPANFRRTAALTPAASTALAALTTQKTLGYPTTIQSHFLKPAGPPSS